MPGSGRQRGKDRPQNKRSWSCCFILLFKLRLIPNCSQCQQAKKDPHKFLSVLCRFTENNSGSLKGVLQFPPRTVFHGKPVIWVSKEQGSQSCDMAGKVEVQPHVAGRSYFQKLLPGVFSSLGGQHPFNHILLPLLSPKHCMVCSRHKQK